jgi:hypothetical protein
LSSVTTRRSTKFRYAGAVGIGVAVAAVVSGCGQVPTADRDTPAVENFPCAAAELRTSLGPEEVGLGNAGVVIGLTNIGRRPCVVRGYGGYQLVDAQSRPMQTTVRPGSTYFHADPQPEPVRLPIGATVYADLHWTANADEAHGEREPCRVPSAFLRITPPGATDSLTVPFTETVCFAGQLDTTAFATRLLGPSA